MRWSRNTFRASSKSTCSSDKKKKLRKGADISFLIEHNLLHPSSLVFARISLFFPICSALLIHLSKRPYACSASVQNETSKVRTHLLNDPLSSRACTEAGAVYAKGIIHFFMAHLVSLYLSHLLSHFHFLFTLLFGSQFLICSTSCS